MVVFRVKLRDSFSRSIGLSYSLYILLTSCTWIAYSLFEDIGFLSSVLLPENRPQTGHFIVFPALLAAIRVIYQTVYH